ncbi:MAG TPA: ClcB-like voltage-gated chloride channel protein [Verrucomicrobiae bacterium]
MHVVKGWRALDEFLSGILPFMRRHLRRALDIRERIRINEETLHLILAGVVGVIGGLTNLLFYGLFQLVMMLGIGEMGEVVEVAGGMSWWGRLITPAIGGLVAGLILYWGLKLVRNQGASNILEVVVSGNGRLPMRTALVKGLSSLVSIGTGASIGREGAITQLAATLGSKFGQLFKWPPYRLRLLVACGAASGMAAAYNAPVAGSIFAAHIVLGNFSMTLFAPVIFAAVVATMVSRYFFGFDPFYEMPTYDFKFLSQLPWFIVLGVISGVMSALFLKAIRFSENAFARVKAPVYARTALGGVVVGVLAIKMPAVWGNGYGAINSILHDPVTHWTLLFLFAAKFVAILACVGSGMVGGVFTPSLFLGAALGSLFGLILNQVNWTSMPTGAYAMVGMGSLLAGVIHAPLLAMIMIFEISLNYSIMPPLMLACAVSTLVARRLHPDSIYTEPLRVKGIVAGLEEERFGEATQTFVGEIMREPVPPVRENVGFQTLAERFLTSTNNFIPVIDGDQKLVGMVALHDMKEYLHTGHEMNGVIAYDLMREAPATLTPNQKLVEAFPVLLQSELRNVPVVNNRIENKLIGSVSRAEALALISEALAARRGE